MSGFKIFIVEDNALYSELLEFHLSSHPDLEIKKFYTANDFLEALYENPDVVTLDYKLPDMNGSEVLKKIKDYNPDIQVIVVSGQEDVGTAIELIKYGAFDYLVKNDETKTRISLLINHIREQKNLKAEIYQLQEEVNKKYEVSKTILGNSQAMQKTIGYIQKAIKTNITVSISGETGTGKELVAKAIHFNSARKRRNFVTVNLAAIPKNLIESELFGYEKGAFTGATARRIGKFEEANRGTIFLDEIGELEMNLQAKLLRVLQEKEITRIGGNAVIPLDVRIIVATHKNLSEEVSNGRFREDLFYRLLGMPIHLPPLRARDHDVILLANSFLESFCKENNIKKLSLAPSTKRKLLDYPFPGNVRELKAIIELAAVMVEGEVIQPEDISLNFNEPVRELLVNEQLLDDYIKKIIQHYLDKYESNVLLVASKLGVGKSTIYKMIKNKELKVS